MSKTTKKAEKPQKTKKVIDWNHIAMRFVFISIVFTSYMVLMDALVGDEVKWANVVMTTPQVLFAAYLLLWKKQNLNNQIERSIEGLRESEDKTLVGLYKMLGILLGHYCDPTSDSKLVEDLQDSFLNPSPLRSITSREHEAGGNCRYCATNEMHRTAYQRW